jgi:ribosome-binding protein aMBF1 (putative translation factor)
MNRRTTWEQLKAERAGSEQRQRGYDQADQAIRLAHEIHALREQRGLSQSELATRVGTTQSAIARLESGSISPSLKTLQRVANALGVTLVVAFAPTDEGAAAQQ